MHPHVHLLPQRLEHAGGQGCARDGSARAKADPLQHLNRSSKMTARQLEGRTRCVDLSTQGKNEALSVRTSNGLGRQWSIYPLLDLTHQPRTDPMAPRVRMDLNVDKSTSTVNYRQPRNRISDDSILVQRNPGDDIRTVDAINQRTGFSKGDHLDVLWPHIAENNVPTHVALLGLATPLTSLCLHSSAFCHLTSPKLIF